MKPQTSTLFKQYIIFSYKWIVKLSKLYIKNNFFFKIILKQNIFLLFVYNKNFKIYKNFLSTKKNNELAFVNCLY